jgi:hypothetical protein
LTSSIMGEILAKSELRREDTADEDMRVRAENKVEALKSRM